MGNFVSFVVSAVKQWRTIVTGSLVLAVISLIEPIFKVHVPRWVYVMVVCLTLFWAFFRAWESEHCGKIDAETRLAEAEKRFTDQAPKIMFGLLGPVDWSSLDLTGEYVFTLTNYGKRPATYVKVSPIKSQAGIMTIYFQDQDILRPDGHYQPVAHEIEDGQTKTKLSKRKLWDFLHNCSSIVQEEDFEIEVTFKDMGEEKRMLARMRFDLNTKNLSVLPS